MNTSIIVIIEPDELRKLVDRTIRENYQYGSLKLYEHTLKEFTVLNNGKLMATYDEKPEEPAKEEEPRATASVEEPL